MCEYCRCVSDGAGKDVLDMQKFVFLSLRMVKVQRVTVVKFGMYKWRWCWRF